MPIVYNEEESRTEDTEAGVSISSVLRHPSGYFEYILTTNDQAFSILAERHSLWDGPTDLRVPPSERIIYVNSFKQILEWKNGTAIADKKVHVDYTPYKSIIASLLKVHHTSGDPESTIKVIVDFSNIDRYQEKREML